MAILTGYGSRVIGPYSPKAMADGTASALIQFDLRGIGGNGGTEITAASATGLVTIEPFMSLGNHYFLVTYLV